MSIQNEHNKVLIVEDDPSTRNILTRLLIKKKVPHILVKDPNDELNPEVKLEWVIANLKNKDIGVIILDLAWNDNDRKIFESLAISSNLNLAIANLKKSKNKPGVLSLLEYLDTNGLFIPVLILTVWKKFESIVELLGIYRIDRKIVQKPNTNTISSYENLIYNDIEKYLRAKKFDDYFKDQFIGDSLSYIELRSDIMKIAENDETVFITGETGMGKTQIAKCIHILSKRKNKPFKNINIAAIPPTLLYSILFGHIKGSFTDAKNDKSGLFEDAKGGTVFLDEIGDMNVEQQVYLLKAIQEKKIFRLGDHEERDIDVRIICATHHNLQKLMQEGRFREDLYFRLRVLPLHLKPLRECKQNIPILIEHFINKYDDDKIRNEIRTNKKDMDIMVSYNYPGNIRQLESIVKRSIVMGISLVESLNMEEIQEKQIVMNKINIDNILESMFITIINENKGYEDIIDEIIKLLILHVKKIYHNDDERAKYLKMSKSAYEYQLRRLRKKGLINGK